ncbi:hypothetical protein BGZ54_005171, partial [Gamsiella multidivaricata]
MEAPRLARTASVTSHDGEVDQTQKGVEGVQERVAELQLEDVSSMDEDVSIDTACKRIAALKVDLKRYSLAQATIQLRMDTWTEGKGSRDDAETFATLQENVDVTKERISTWMAILNDLQEADEEIPFVQRARSE